MKSVPNKLEPRPNILPEVMISARINRPGFIETSRAAVTLLKQARQESIEIIKIAEKDAEAIRVEAYKKAYSEGLQEALQNTYSLASQEAKLISNAQKQLCYICERVCKEVLLSLPDALQTSISKKVAEAVADFESSPVSLIVPSPEILTSEIRHSLDNLEISIRTESSLGEDEFILTTAAGNIRCSLSEHLNSLLELIHAQSSIAFPIESLGDSQLERVA